MWKVGVFSLVLISPFDEVYLENGQLTESDVEESVSDLLKSLDKHGIEYEKTE
ncbi:hypothetical protein [Pseudogracilibacillus sp. SO30301A]|uniref:hypothetical protein n=1 Tax=Pseudogracilibacillus sp. SO30301A TaxID=3098291 RepID=UPI00300DEC7D